jgi:hypothetical protein
MKKMITYNLLELLPFSLVKSSFSILSFFLIAIISLLLNQLFFSTNTGLLGSLCTNQGGMSIYTESELFSTLQLPKC